MPRCPSFISESQCNAGKMEFFGEWEIAFHLPPFCIAADQPFAFDLTNRRRSDDLQRTAKSGQ